MGGVGPLHHHFFRSGAELFPLVGDFFYWNVFGTCNLKTKHVCASIWSILIVLPSFAWKRRWSKLWFNPVLLSGLCCRTDGGLEMAVKCLMFRFCAVGCGCRVWLVRAGGHILSLLKTLCIRTWKALSWLLVIRFCAHRNLTIVFGVIGVCRVVMPLISLIIIQICWVLQVSKIRWRVDVVWIFVAVHVADFKLL